MAAQRGAVFEVSYGSGMLENSVVNRKVFLNNALTIIKMTKGGKNVIFSADAHKRINMRAPIDVM